MEKNRVIYRFWHELSDRGLVGYIGKDCYHPSRFSLNWRAKSEYCPLLFRALNKYPLEVWHREILQSDFESDEQLSQAEIYWIAKFDSKNKGYNLTDGGDGVSGCIPSEETREKMSAWQRGRKLSPEHCENLSKANKGKKLSSEHKEKIRLAGIGRKPTDETRRKLSNSKMGSIPWNKGKKLSADHLKNLSLSLSGDKNGMYGKHHSVQTRKKLSRQRRGKKHWNYGKKRPPEVIRKIRETILKRNAKQPRTAVSGRA